MRRRTKNAITNAIAWVLTVIIFIVGGAVLIFHYPWLILLIPFLILGLLLNVIDRLWKKKKKPKKRRRKAESLFRLRPRVEKRTVEKKIIETRIMHTIVVQHPPQEKPAESPKPERLPEKIADDRASLYGGKIYCRQCGERMIMESESPEHRAATFRCNYCGKSEIIPRVGGGEINAW